jgi:hypothetical protein
MTMPKSLAAPYRLSARRCVLLASTVQAVIAAAILGICWHRVAAYGGDVSFYYNYAIQTFNGDIPYRQFEIEYPLLALPIMALPYLFAKKWFWYQVGFAAEMICWNVLTVALVARWVERAEGEDRVFNRLAWYTAFSALMSPLLLVRYDLAPTSLGFAAAAWWSSGRALAGGLAAGTGVLVKVFPGVCVLPSLVREIRSPHASRLRGACALTATVLLGLMAWIAIAGQGFLASVKYHAARGFEVGSLYAGAAMLLGSFTGNPPEIEWNYGAFHLGGPWAARLAPLAFPVQAATLLVVLGMCRKSGYRGEMRCAAAALLAYVIMGKVLSPQYLIWLIPFIAALDGPTGRWARPIFALSCLATTLTYPFFFDRLLGLEWGPILLLNVRNALLLTLLAILTFGNVPSAEALDRMRALNSHHPPRP